MRDEDKTKQQLIEELAEMRRRSVEALRESEEKALAITESAMDAIVVIDNDGRIIYWNPSAEKTFGYDEDEALGKGVHTFIAPPGYYEAFKRGYAHFKNTGEGGAIGRTFEFSAIRKGGAEFPIEISLSSFRIRGLWHSAAIIRDVTDRRLMEERLLEEKIFAENLMDNTAIAAFVLNKEHKVVLWNKACEELTGVLSADVIGTGDHWRPFYPGKRPTMADIVIDGDYRSVPDLYGTHTRSPLLEGGFQAEGWYENMNGMNRYILFEAAPIYNSRGELSFAIETLQDISRRKKTEEELEIYKSRLEDEVRERTLELMGANRRLEEDIRERKRMEDEILKMHKLESIGVLAGGIAHDFNNLLSAIMGNISLARRHAPDGGRVTERLVEAEKASARAMDLARQLLIFSKGGDPIKTVLLVSEPVRDAADFALRGSNIGLEILVPDDLWAVEADEGQITQVVNNIVINARQAMPEGGKVSIRCENVVVGQGDIPPLQEGNFVRVSIGDEGAGIRPEYLKRIFDPYFTTKQEGSGLGLATSYSIIKRHGGHLTVEAEPGDGSIFHIYLPAIKRKGIAGRKEEKRLFPGRGRALVMDDEEIIRFIVGEMLEEIGYHCEFAEDGARAVESYLAARSEGAPFDVVLLDLTVRGGMGGMDCITRLKEIDPGIRAIVSSGYCDDPVMASYREFGFQGLITKPYQIEDLSKILHEVMGAGDPAEADRER